MPMIDPKKVASVLVAKRSGNGHESFEEDSSNDGNIAIDSAAEEILKAVESKDPSALVEALKSFIEMCKHESNEEY